MPRRTEEPTVRPSGGAHRDGDTFTHPAFGQIGASRWSGGTTLYGSDFIHHNFVVITINRSELTRDLAHDWHHSREELVEVALSEAQWASFVSSMNVGGGVPCTIMRVAGEQMPDIPLRRQEDAFRSEAKETMGRMAKQVAATIAEVEGELGTALSKVKRERLLEHLHQLERSLKDGLPWIASTLEKHMETTVEKAKVEVNAYIGQAVQRAGLEALGVGPLRLGAGPAAEEGEVNG
jgi:hypothetical protein